MDAKKLDLPSQSFDFIFEKGSYMCLACLFYLGISNKRLRLVWFKQL